MEFICYTDWEQLPDSTDALFERTAETSIFLTRSWFENLASSAPGVDQSMILACVVAGNKVLAILPLVNSGRNSWNALKHRYTTHYSLLLADDKQPQILACLVQGLSRLSIRSLLLEPVADNDSRIIGLRQALETEGYRCEDMFRFYNWIYPVQGQSYQDYMAARPTRLRNTIARKQRKLAREHGYEIRMFSGGDVPRAMSDYYAVYSASWKANEQFAGFLDGIVAGFSKPGWSRLAVLYVQDKPVAAQLWFVLRGKANIFRLAYDEAWKRYSPGSILTSYLMEYVIEVDKVDEIDFLTGNDAYKQDWMSERRQRLALSCVKNTRPAGKFQLFIEWLRSALNK